MGFAHDLRHNPASRNFDNQTPASGGQMKSGSTAARMIATAGALLCSLAALPANAQLKEYQEPQASDGSSFRPIVSKASANNEIFATLKTRCETDASCGKASGDVCAEAAAVLLGNDPPDLYRDLGSVQRSKVALRLLERGVDNSNMAAARAYDLYGKTDIAGILTGGVADPFRANELMELMIKRNYSGAALRKARSGVSLLGFASSDTERRQHCEMAGKMLAGGKLDVDSKAIANEIIDSSACKTLAAQAQQTQN